MSIADIDTSDANSPAEYVEKLRAENRVLRRELIAARSDFEQALLVIARLKVEHKQYQDAMVEGILNLE